MNLPKEITTITPLSKLVAVILFFALPIIGFYLGLYYKQAGVISSSQPNYQQNTVYPTPAITAVVPQPSSIQQITSEVNETDEWLMKKASVCNVIIPIPPKKTQYSLVGTDGEVISAWNFREYTEKGSSINDMQFENTAIINIDWSEGVQNSRALLEEGFISVNCSKNTKNYTTQSFAQEFASMFATVYTSSDGTSRWEVTQQQQQIWQKDVIALSMSSTYQTDTYYVFADSENVYLIMRESRSDDPNVKNTTNHIFNTLQFASAQ